MFLFQKNRRKASQSLGNVWHTSAVLFPHVHVHAHTPRPVLVNGPCLIFVIGGKGTVQDWKNLHQVHLAEF